MLISMKFRIAREIYRLIEHKAKSDKDSELSFDPATTSQNGYSIRRRD